jgi:hypothetical protein
MVTGKKSKKLLEENKDLDMIICSFLEMKTSLKNVLFIWSNPWKKKYKNNLKERIQNTYLNMRVSSNKRIWSRRWLKEWKLKKKMLIKLIMAWFWAQINQNQ